MNGVHNTNSSITCAGATGFRVARRSCPWPALGPRCITFVEPTRSSITQTPGVIETAATDHTPTHAPDGSMWFDLIRD
jgi:hypothetical protein